jgi:hypothetical protein
MKPGDTKILPLWTLPSQKVWRSLIADPKSTPTLSRIRSQVEPLRAEHFGDQVWPVWPLVERQMEEDMQY